MATRAETQAATRAKLIEAADSLYAEQGVATSIREVAKRAGYTRGAFYANFDSPEDLFLAVLDERFAARMERLETEGGPREVADGWVAHLDADRDWHAAFLEFVAHAGRTPAFRARLAERYGALRARMARGFERRVPDGVDTERLAAMAFVCANGLAVERLIDPEVANADLYAELVELLGLGLAARTARSRARARTRAGRTGSRGSPGSG